MSKTRLLLVLILILMAGAYFLFDLGQYFSLEFFRSQQEKIELYFAENPLQTALIFFCIYVAVTGLSLPDAERAERLEAFAAAFDGVHLIPVSRYREVAARLAGTRRSVT